MNDDYRLRADLQRIIANAGEAPHWNTASDRPEVPAHYTRAEIQAAVHRAIEACAVQAGVNVFPFYGHMDDVSDKKRALLNECARIQNAIRAIATDPAALERIIEGGKG